MEQTSDFLQRNINTVSGVGEARAKLFAKIGIITVSDLLMHHPRDYDDRTITKKIADLSDGESACVRGITVTKMSGYSVRQNMKIQKITVRDDSGAMHVTFFNQDYVSQAFSNVGQEFVFYGKVSKMPGEKCEMNSPIFEEIDKNRLTGRIVPQYALTANLSQKVLMGTVESCIRHIDFGANDIIPTSVRMKYELCNINFAIKNIHFPATMEDMLTAKRRFIFEELLLFSLGLGLLKDRRENISSIPLEFDIKKVMAVTSSLSYNLTNDQKKCISDILNDLRGKKPMNRLVQGDVGSGKTIIAQLAMYAAVLAGKQAVIMAPTEILAKQHYDGFCELFLKLGIKVCLYKGNLKAKEKAELLQQIKSGDIDMIVGTHALIQETVQFASLGIVVTDEQHRFGVRQRAALSGKEDAANVLVMSATPIPRTLSLILYGDLDVSQIREMPAGRRPVKTFAVGEDMRGRIKSFALKEVMKGRQVYAVCPLVEESEAVDLNSATELAEKLQKETFSNFKVGLVHGRLKQAEKDAIMASFLAGDINVLVATTVVEVGVNVPNATLMIIENAERFGLSQLHQLRGRVGRGVEQSHCVMFNQSASETTAKRMDIMCRTNDGFRIAETDLEIRGGGQVFGTRQHGLPELKISSLLEDYHTFQAAKECADEMLSKDPQLNSAENLLLKSKTLEMFDDCANIIVS